MLWNFPEESKGNTCVFFSGYWHFKCFTSCFHQLLSKVMKLRELLLSGQEGHPGIKLLACRGSLGSFDLILFCCLHFLYLPVFYLLSLSFMFKVHPAFSSHNHKRFSRIISQHVSVQRREYLCGGQPAFHSVLYPY